MGSMKPPGIEICDGIDNDCDGKVDELDSASNRTTDDELVYIQTARSNVTMFAYEASRYDAHRRPATASTRPAAPAPSRASCPGPT